MNTGMKTVAAVLGMAAALSVISDAHAVTAYVGRGTTGISDSAVAAWVQSRGGTWFEDAAQTLTATAPNNIPLPNAGYTGTSAVTATSASTMSVAAGLSMTGTNDGVINGPHVLGASLNRNFNLSNFSSTVTSFGFFIQNYGTAAQNQPITITLTDAAGKTSIITVATSGTVGISGTAAPTSVLSSNDTNYKLNGGVGQTSEFIGFSDITGITSIVVGAGGTTSNANKLEIGDFFTSTAPAPEPASLVLLGAGLLGLGLARRRKAA